MMKNDMSDLLCKKKPKILIVGSSFISAIPAMADVISPLRQSGRLRRFVFAGLRQCGWHSVVDRYLVGWDWISRVDTYKYDAIIVMDLIRNYRFLCTEIEHKFKRDTRLILYLWNPAAYSSDYAQLSPRWEKCSFSAHEATAIGMRFIPPFYAAQVRRNPTSSNEVDFFFVGLDKGRRAIIESLRVSFEKMGFSYRLVVVNNHRSWFDRRYNRAMPYTEVLDWICKTRCLVDIIQDGQTGCTQRVMESLFYGKKLLTNMSCIKDFEFYNKENIFVFGVDDMNSLNDFIRRPLRPYSPDVIEKYTIDGWIKRIISAHQYDND